MQEYPRKYSPLEKKADKLWAEWHPQEDASAFWQGYDELLLRARKVQKNVVISQAKASAPPPVSVQQQTTATTPSSVIKVPLLRVMFLTLALFFALGVVVYFLANNRPAEQPLIESSTIHDPTAEAKPANSWKLFEATHSSKSTFNPAIPDSLAIASYKISSMLDNVKQTQREIRKRKEMIKRIQAMLKDKKASANDLAILREMKNDDEFLLGKNQQKLRTAKKELDKWREWYKQAYGVYLNVLGKQATSLPNDLQMADAWRSFMRIDSLPKNLSEHNQPVYDLAVSQDTSWLFVGDRQSFTLYRVRCYKEEYFALNSLDKLEPINLATQTVYKAQIKVYYFGQLVTYTPPKIYYELNGKQNNIAVKDFDKLEKRLEISQHYPKVK